MHIGLCTTPIPETHKVRPGCNAAYLATTKVAQRLVGCSRAVRLDAKVHVSLAEGRHIIYGLVVDEDTQREVATLVLPG